MGKVKYTIMNINEGFGSDGFKSPFAGFDKIDDAPELLRNVIMTALLKTILRLVQMMSERNLVEFDAFLARYEAKLKCPQAIKLSQHTRMSVRLVMFFRTECETRLLTPAAISEIKASCSCGDPGCLCAPCDDPNCACHGKGHQS